jgi:hypothetical protein
MERILKDAVYTASLLLHAFHAKSQKQRSAIWTLQPRVNGVEQSRHVDRQALRRLA